MPFNGVLRPMFGREEELDRVVDLLRSERLVTITGRGGVGKTRLAEEVAAGWAPGAVSVVPLSGVTDPALLMVETAAALGLQAGGDNELRDAVVGRLGTPGQLLVLDNLEHLLDGIAAPLLDVLDSCPGLRVLTTSQAPTGLPGEHVVRLVPLAVPPPEPGAPQAVAEFPSVAAYCERAGAMDRGFRLDDDNAADIARLCRRLEGLPLALELAAARYPTLPPAVLLRLLDASGPAVLADGTGSSPARHQDLLAAVSWTYAVLDDRDQRLLQRLAVVAGSFDVDAALDLAGEVGTSEALDGLSRLVDLHLVDPVGPGGQRFSIPMSIREVALAELDASGERAEAERWHVEVRARQARAAAERSEWSGQESAGLALESDRDDLFACLDRALSSGAVDEALHLARGLACLWDRRGYERNAEAVLERVLRAAATADADPVAHAAVLAWSAELGLRHGATTAPEELRARIDRSMELGVAHGHAPTRFHTVCVRLLTTPFTGDVDGAREALDVGLGLVAETGEEAWAVILQTWAGMLAALFGDEETALDQGLAALGGALRLDDRESIVRVVLLLGALDRPDPTRVRTVPSYEETLAIAREVDLPMYEGLLLCRIVAHRSWAGDTDGALRAAREGLDVAAIMPTSPTVGYHLVSVAQAASSAGDLEVVAFLHGVVEESLPLLQLTQADRHTEAYERQVARCREQLGESTFEALVRQGAGCSYDQGRALAALYLDRALAARGGEVDDPAPVAGAPAAASGQDLAEVVARLTERQVEVLRLMAKGLTNKDIAARLGVRPKTVMHHTMAIYREIGVQGRGEATAWAFRAGLID